MEQKDIDPISKESVHDALRHYNEQERLGEHSLARLRCVEEKHQAAQRPDTPGSRGLSLQDVFQEAIKRIYPDEELNLSEKHSIYRFILTEHFIARRKVSYLRDCLSESQLVPKGHGTYYRWQRKAIKELANKLRELEDGAREIPAVQVDAVPFLALPKPPYSLVGRSSLLQQLKEKLFAGDNVALYALNGLPGVGKTALAIELAYDKEVLSHFRDGVLWAGLGREPDVLALLGNWALALGCTSGEIAKRTTVEDRQALLRSAIGQRHMLLVIDDAWQSQAALAFQVGGVNCAHLVTTRQPSIALDFAGEGLRTVTELSLDDGLALLKTLAPAVVTEPNAAQELVEAVGGLPLALVLMGQYLKREAHGGQARRIRAAVARLREVESRLRVEVTSMPPGYFPGLPAGVPLSLLAAIATSDEALDSASRRTLYALSVFPPTPNTFSEEAALAVADAPVEALDTLTDYGLLEGVGPSRYKLHQAIADYAVLKRTDEDVDKRMVAFFANYVEAHERECDALEQEIANILAALELASTLGMQAELVDGTNAVSYLLKVRGLYRLAETLLSRAEQTARTLDDATNLVKTLHNLGRAVALRGKYIQAEAHFEEALRLARESGDRVAVAGLLGDLGHVAVRRGAHDQAEAYFKEGLRLAEESGDQETFYELHGYLYSLTWGLWPYFVD